jgi:hypothetical protein
MEKRGTGRGKETRAREGGEAKRRKGEGFIVAIKGNARKARQCPLSRSLSFP